MDTRILTEHNGTFHISIPAQYLAKLHWFPGQKLVIELSENPQSLTITSPDILLNSGNHSRLTDTFDRKP